MSNTIITITGPSCSGKSTLAKLLMATGNFTEVISTTTRPQRAGEVNGVNYHYVTPEQFDEIEMLERIEFNGNTYGGSVAEFEEKFASGKIPVIVVEPNGLQQINLNATDKDWTVVNIFAGCPSLLQAERFLPRLLEDYRTIIAQGSGDDYAKFMAEYTNRMASMQDVESKWVGMFREYMIPENAIQLEAFTKENESRVVGTIVDRITGLTQAA